MNYIYDSSTERSGGFSYYYIFFNRFSITKAGGYLSTFETLPKISLSSGNLIFNILRKMWNYYSTSRPTHMTSKLDHK